MSKAQEIRRALDDGCSVAEAARRAGAYYSYAYGVAVRHRKPKAPAMSNITVTGGDRLPRAPSGSILQANILEERGHQVCVVETNEGEPVCRTCRKPTEYSHERTGWVHATGPGLMAASRPST